MKALIFAAALVPTLAAAHPHVQVEQQLGFSIGRAKLELTWFVVPSAVDGANIFEHIDTDGDGMVDPAEANAFAADLIAATSLTVDGAEVVMRMVEVEVPDQAVVLSGQALIKATATADLPLPDSVDTTVTLRIDHDTFAKDWYIQPLFQPDLAAGEASPKVIRKDSTVTITVPQVGS